VRRAREHGRSWASATTPARVAIGVPLMYATAFLLQVRAGHRHTLAARFRFQKVQAP
jgi:hypothetical protein